MERLRSLIKEALSTPPKKKDCNCGCGGCDKKTPIITEGRIKKAISEGLTYHVENKIPLHESVYRIGSEKHFALINEARKLWVRGLIDVSEDDQAILETHLGNFGMYEGEKVPLDMPMVNEDMREWPKELTSRYSDEYRFELEKVTPTYKDKPGRAKYRLIDIESGELKATPVFGTPESLMAYADNLIKPQGGTQSSNFGESVNEENKSFNFPMEFKLEKDINYDSWGVHEDKLYKGTFVKDLILSDHKRAIYVNHEGKQEVTLDQDDIRNLERLGVLKESVNEEKGYGADTAWKDEEGNKVTLEDILDMTKNIPQKDYPTEKLAKVVLNWDDNPKEVERIDQVEVSKQYPILIMVGEDEKIKWILDGNHRAQKALRSKSETIPAKLIKPSNLSSKAKKILLGVVDESLNEAKKKKKKEKKDPPLGKPKRGGSKAYYVYVRDPKTKRIKKVSFGSGGLRAKIKNKEARKRFASRHNCDKKKDRTTAGYWSCNLPRYAEQLGLGSNMSTFW